MGYPRRLSPDASAALDRLAAVAEIRQLVQALAAAVDDRLAAGIGSALDAGAPATKTADAAGLTRRQLEALIRSSR